jgi:hypothetical protein
MREGDRRYDYGMRGRDDSPAGRGGRPSRAPMGGRSRIDGADERMETRTPRVTARYNREYVHGPSGDEVRSLNPNPYGDDGSGRIGGADRMQRPYTTVAGTRTFRGSPPPPRYDRMFSYDRGFRRR